MRESRLWVLFLFAGLAMIILLGVHMAVMHMDAILGFFGIEVGTVLDYGSVMTRAGSIYWTVFYVVLLALGLYHGLYGLRSLLIELIRGQGGQSFITGLLVVIGLALFIFGTYVTVQSYALGGV